MGPIPTDLELVDIAAGTYAPSAVPDFEDAGHAVRIFLTKRFDGLNVLAVEGTHDAIGWALDFVATPLEDQQGMNHATLGFIHAGFYEAAVASLARCALVAASGPYAICGHSLGAALALLIGALLSQDIYEGRALAPVKIGAFAPPRVGGSKFVSVVTKMPFCAYRFGGDPVTEVPFSLPPGFPYAQVALTHVGPPEAQNAMGDVIGLIRGHHHITNYVESIHQLAALEKSGIT